MSYKKELPNNLTKKLLDFFSKDTITYNISKFIINHSIITILLIYVIVMSLTAVFIIPILPASCECGRLWYWALFIIGYGVTELIICSYHWNESNETFNYIEKFKDYVNDELPKKIEENKADNIEENKK